MNLLIQNRGKGPQCNPLIAEIATRDAIKAEIFTNMAAATNTVLPARRSRGQSGPRYFESRRHFLRNVRFGIYSNDFQFIEEIFEDYYKHNYPHSNEPKVSMEDIASEILNNPFAPEWIEQLPPDWYNDVLSSIVTQSDLYLLPIEQPYRYLHNRWLESTMPNDTNGVTCSNHLRFVLTQHLICRGQFQQAEAVLESISNRGQDAAAVFWGWLSFLNGNVEEAIAHYTVALSAYRQARRNKKAYFNTVGGLFFILALIQEGSATRLEQAKDYAASMAKQQGHWLQQTYDLLMRVIQVQQGDFSQVAYISIQAQTSAIQAKRHSFEHLISALSLYWVDPKTAPKLLSKQLKPIYERAKTNGFNWLAMECAALLSRTSNTKTYGKESTAFFKDHPTFTPLAELIRSLEPWEISLKALTNLTKGPESQAKQSKVAEEKRMAWMVTLYGNQSWLLQPREQKITKSGKWGKGRNIALRRLHEDRSQFDYLTPQDFQVLAHLKSYRAYTYYGGLEHEFGSEAMVALIGHPLVFWEESPTVRIDVVKGEPELLVEDQGTGYLHISFSLKTTSKESISLIKESPTRLKVIEITEDYRRIATILGANNTLQVPANAKEQVLAAINSIASLVTVHSDIGGGMESVEEVPADATPHIHLLPSGDGLNVSILCRPFSEAGPYYSPGTGGKNVIAEIEGQRLQTNRNLQQEKNLAQAVVSQCSSLSRQDGDSTEWLLDDPEDCLELLFELQDLADVAVV
ncbi:MAG: ATP-dependent helicase, partial [Cyanobacteria bacterium P01_A01_bin.123]